MDSVVEGAGYTAAAEAPGPGERRIATGLRLAVALATWAAWLFHRWP